MDFKLSKQVKELLESKKDNYNKGSNGRFYEDALKAIDKVLVDPLNRAYIKRDLGSYRAVSVSDQIRLFFEIVDKKTVFFVWINDEGTKHISAKKERDPCYSEFKTLIGTGKVEIFVPDVFKAPEFIINGQFFVDTSIYCTYKDNKAFSDAYLELQKQEIKSQYHIVSTHENPFGSNVIRDLFKNICAAADDSSVNLSCNVELFRDFDYQQMLSRALIDNNFKEVGVRKEDSARMFLRLARAS
jgi:hypothetical protein